MLDHAIGGVIGAIIVIAILADYKWFQVRFGESYLGTAIRISLPVILGAVIGAYVDEHFSEISIIALGVIVGGIALYILKDYFEAEVEQIREEKKKLREKLHRITSGL